MAEVVPEVVAAVRRAGGRYRVNIATPTGIVVQEVRGVEIFNPMVPADAQALAEALAEASEIATALPSVEFYHRGEPSVAGLIAEAVRRKAAEIACPLHRLYGRESQSRGGDTAGTVRTVGAQPAAVRINTLLQRGVNERLPRSAPVQFLNTVIGKMSGVVTAPEQIEAEGLASLAADCPRALLVEEFNRILITQIDLPGFRRGIEVFIEKPDLLPFEEAKLYGHNAVHALIGYLARRKGCRFMSEAAKIGPLMALARGAFLEESGAALIARHQGLDPLFTPAGYQAYADDLLERMTNPYLRDRTERIIRDTRRKLGWDDRLIGTMRLALDAGVTPHRFAFGAAAALETLGSKGGAADQLNDLWPAVDEPPGRKAQLIQLITEAQAKLKNGAY